MTKEEAIAKLDEMPQHGDEEMLHSQADNILQDFLDSIGESDVANAFRNARERVGFWYA